ncbi:MAG: hypothetical protein IJM76_04315 [Lachnospiraceae bacterium]|nr:hypothetical protein [Lachnospiraceae bacterium]
MANGAFSTDPLILKERGGQLKGYSEEYLKIGNEILNAATTMGQAYDSQDNRVFVEQINEFYRALQEMAKKLENAGEILNVQSQLYTAREDENTSIAQKLPS